MWIATASVSSWVQQLCHVQGTAFHSTPHEQISELRSSSTMGSWDQAQVISLVQQLRLPTEPPHLPLLCAYSSSIHRSQTLEIALCSWWIAHASLMIPLRQIFLLGPHDFPPPGAHVLIVDRAHDLLPATGVSKVTRGAPVWHTVQDVVP